MTTATTSISGVRAVSIFVTDQDKALRFYVDILGFDKLRDVRTTAGGPYAQRPHGRGADLDGSGAG